ncbi:MAG: HAD-IIIC family phosphatase [Ruminococcaceae bacterium]|nr:HAD-IIIC family phosphatase [Oscillospiraceae bacterium]
MPNFYPFDPAELTKKQRSIKRALLSDGANRIKKKIAVLGGSTTNGIVDMLELFLLWQGIQPDFYQSEYNQYWQDAMFSEELREFKPDFVFIHTSNRNITDFPEMSMSSDEVNALLQNQLGHFTQMWDKLKADLSCPIVQNNMELPYWRLLGNKDCADFHGRVSFISRLNQGFYDYAAKTENFFIHDINYLSAQLGLEKWSDPLYWNMYKYAVAVPLIPEFAFSLSKIFASLLGKNKKVLALDLDNTLWGGVVGDDGAEKLALGQEVPMGQAYCEFQSYIKAQKQLGVLLTVCSKNDHENAIAGLNHPDGVLKPEDFTLIKANWEPKSLNIEQTAKELNLLPESIVFVDDNPAEREIVKGTLPVEAPPMESIESYIHTLDKGGYFEVTNFSEDDLHRTEMYKQNAERAKMQSAFADYGEYLDSLEMKAVIEDFSPINLARVTQLTNKSNQFNVTTRRYTQSDMEQVFESPDYIRLCGRLEDKFGDNGIVSVVIGRKDGETLDIDLWLMSCRVLKRDMELAMLDTLVKEAVKQGVKVIKGHYYPTAKNKMVKELFGDFGFEKISEDEEGNTLWELKTEGYKNKNLHIAVNC